MKLHKTKISSSMWQNTQFRLLGDKILKNGFFSNYKIKLSVLYPYVHDKADLLRLTKILSSRWQNTRFHFLCDKISKNRHFGNYKTKLRVLCPDVRDNANLLCFNIISSYRWQNLFSSFPRLQMLIRAFWSRREVCE
jgi:hypothetical protein